ncbi:DoxX family membrane protein [Alkalihalobacillus sp. LMS39]|uniref:DoxX family membrane protein n=1 Tax=Alkalihalobacillus sp. LMS39 TaxID=2924032 RepID=UPI001FB2B963|nr:DoxX family membrane protein [Alkalihalobacillus sp. LMS39]UOE96197.1 DoxX family membrane protein [Alkalihalobacillus sp. LMS39]
MLKNLLRLFLGIVFLGAGLNGFLVIFSIDPLIETSEQAMVLFQFDYLLVAVKSLEVLCGALLCFNRYVPLALALLAPISVNILLLHIFVDHALLPLALILFIVHGVLVVFYKDNFHYLLEK